MGIVNDHRSTPHTTCHQSFNSPLSSMLCHGSLKMIHMDLHILKLSPELLRDSIRYQEICVMQTHSIVSLFELRQGLVPETQSPTVKKILEEINATSETS